MIFILEGTDAVGKSTQAHKIQSLLLDKPTHFLHYSSLNGFSTIEELINYSYNLYSNMFFILQNNYKTSHFILDRSHISETVYSPMYRNYDGSYVYDIEKNFLIDEKFWEQICLITFIDNPENLIKRDDGLSFSTNINKKKQEIQLFIEATKNSNIFNKKIININNKNIEEVFSEIKLFYKNIIV